MEFYQLSYDMDLIDELIKIDENYIYAETTNIDKVESEKTKKGYFDNIVLKPNFDEKWPNIEFYYSSKVSTKESDYLLNVKRWPIVRVNVCEKLKEEAVNGLRFYPIKLIDVVSKKVNENYYLMYIDNFIDAFDMQKSRYKYNEKYNYYTFIPRQTYLNKEICSNYDIFRCIKSVAAIYVSEKFKKIVEENNWCGFHFEKQD